VTLVVDASVAIKWFFEEVGYRPARALLDRGEPLIAPTLLPIEVGNAAWKRFRKREIGREAAMEVAILSPRPLAELVPADDLMPEAMALALDLTHPIYDCLYLALSRRAGLALATADKRLAALGKQLDVRTELIR